jgi:Spy/CpxP family protein refolding chaperone
MSPFKVSPRVLAALVIVLTLLVGGLAGAVVDRTLVRPRLDGPRAGGPPPGPQRDRDRQEKGRERFVQQMKRDLDLSAQQVARIDSITREGMQKMDALRRDQRARSHALIDSTRVLVDSVLTPQQRQRSQELFKARTARKQAGAPAPGTADSTSGKR